MRILHLTPYYRPAYAFGGVVRSVEGMATALAERGHEVTVLTTDALDQRGRYQGALDEMIDGVRILRRPNLLQWLRGRLNLSTPRSMKKTAASILPSVDVLHIHEFRTLENLLVTPVAQALNKPIALSPHGTLNLSTGRGALKAAWDRTLSPGIAWRIDQVIALTERERAEAEALWSRFGNRQRPIRFSVIPNGVRLGDFNRPALAAEFRNQYDLGDAPTVLFMGRLQARKGVDVLIQAFKAVAAADSRLLIVGPDEGMLPALKSLAGDDARIIFTGYLAGDARLGALAASDVFALPATGEGQPMAALEAMAAGLPVLLSPGCNMDEVAGCGAGFVVEATVQAVAERMKALLGDEALRLKMGGRARRLAESNYSWDEVAENLENLYFGLFN
ncbi:MAG: glycosyltransferase [Chloroflexota bacterium]|nr:glycosyltransferase [Chloroflexota bacterium]